MDKLTALRQSPLLRALEERQLEALAGIAKQRNFAAGSSVITAGTSGALAMFVVLEGEMEVRRDGTVLARLGAGDHFGEMAVLAPDGMPRSADVVAVTDTTVLQVTKWDLMPFLKSNPDVAIALIGELAKRLTETNARLSEA